MIKASSEAIFYSSLTLNVTCGSQQTNHKIIEDKNDYVTCVCSNHWWFALICEVNHDYNNVYSNLHPHRYTPSFYWSFKCTVLGQFGGILHPESSYPP